MRPLLALPALLLFAASPALAADGKMNVLFFVAQAGGGLWRTGVSMTGGEPHRAKKKRK